ncbi:phosphorylase superfamily [Streptococcus lutetiensis]|uniref:nucleoside phosphorylase n=1 Tax=Streptococcus lutetiensis TaxID=150055 RepID=UPI000F6C8C88|nr:nucleoside phosphorylase [Streptococcus lutetiensis]VEB83096.1 phosphorylase superfamily [Streptococcus lutetiensis]
MILSQFDHQQTAIINPGDVIQALPDFPKTVVTCFARTTFARILAEVPHRQIAKTSMANLEIPVYELDFHGEKIGFFNSYVGASSCVAVLEDIIAMGAENLLVFGTCGVLDNSIKETSIIIPTSAIRDEGTSYHYAPPTSEIALNHTYRKQFKQFLDAQNISYTEGKVWTTDGIYRETHQKTANRKTQGAIAVDMECSAIAAFANFRKINHFQFFYSADNLDSEKWDPRSLANDADLERKDRIASIALHFATQVFK